MPRATTLGVMSSTTGLPSEGTATEIGSVPMKGSQLPKGAILPVRLVQAKPIIPCSAASLV